MIDTISSSPNNFEFIIEEEKNSYEHLLPAFLSRSDQNLREIRIQILDEFGSINNILEISSYNHEIAFQQIIDLKYFSLRQKYFSQKLNKDLIRLIYEQLCLNEEIRSVQCIKRKFKVFEYIDKDSTASKVFYKRKLMRKSCFPIFHYYKDCSFSENLTAILFRHSQIYLNDIRTGRTIGVYNLELPQDCQFYCLFLISNNGLFAYYDHYLMENFKPIKQIKCSYVQFRKDSKQTLLYNLQGNLELFDLIKHQTLFMIRISLITFTDCKQIHIRHSSYLNMQTINDAPKKIALNATSLSRYISHFLGTSKGKDKFMALIQYSFDLYHSCSKHTNITHIKKLIAYNELRSIVVAEQFKDSISQARKIFRLLYFLDEIKGIQRVIRQNKHPLFKLLAISGHYASFMYYVSDNLMWIISVLVNRYLQSLTSGILNPASEHRWKLKKNSFSQLRIVVNLIRLSCILVMRNLKESRIYAQGFNQQDSKKLCLSLIKLRRKRRFEILDLILSILRFFMLTKSLKMKGYQYLDPVFVACFYLQYQKTKYYSLWFCFSQYCTIQGSI